MVNFIENSLSAIGEGIGWLFKSIGMILAALVVIAIRLTIYGVRVLISSALLGLVVTLFCWLVLGLFLQQSFDFLDWWRSLSIGLLIFNVFVGALNWVLKEF